MEISRRTILGGIAATIGATLLPPSIAADPLVTFVPFTADGMLDRWAAMYGLVRLPAAVATVTWHGKYHGSFFVDALTGEEMESDDSLRQRLREYILTPQRPRNVPDLVVP